MITCRPDWVSELSSNGLHELSQLSVAELRGRVMKWLTIDSAPKDGTTILGWCDHEADPYWDDRGKRLTAYGANAEGASHVDDGVNLVRWHDGLADGEYCTPAWWCLADDYGETAANPTHWMPLPEPPVPT